MQRPSVTVYAEVTADGKTVHRKGASSKPMMQFEDAEVQRFRHTWRARSDAIMVGANTVRLDNPHLTTRYAEGQSPLRVVPSATGNLPLDSHLFGKQGDVLVAVSATTRPEVRKRLADAGASVEVFGDAQVDLRALLLHLGTMGIRTLLVEGGATLLRALFDLALVDVLIVQHLPVIFGGSDVPAMVGGAALADVNEAIRLELTSVEKIGRHAVITYACPSA